MRDKFSEWIKKFQTLVCKELETIDKTSAFVTDHWQREEGGGGITKIFKNGKIFEKAGVNTSAITGILSKEIKQQLNVEGHRFFACGVSLVIHPYSPKVPTTHANYRYFEVYDTSGQVVRSWFGGGADLTPYYLDEEDAKKFHLHHKDSCDKFDISFYPTFKKNCDTYFTNTHRNNERRGIGGIFYDYLNPTESINAEKLFAFAQSNGQALIDAYTSIVKKHCNEEFNAQEKKWQLIRRGRYVEFNLIHDRGTLFGLKSNGRTESILMSLPLHVMFEYQHEVLPNSPEEKLLHILLNPIDWIK